MSETVRENDTTWDRGAMTFSCTWCKPPKMNFDEWMMTGEARRWVSKKGEVPSQFIARIIADMEKEGARVWDYLEDEMGDRQK